MREEEHGRPCLRLELSWFYFQYDNRYCKQASAFWFFDFVFYEDELHGAPACCNQYFLDTLYIFRL